MKNQLLAPSPPILVKIHWKGAYMSKVDLSYSEKGFVLQTLKPSSYVKKWLLAYTKRKALPVSSLPFFPQNLSPFATKVYEEMEKVPLGAVITYQELAAKAGSSKAFRAVGTLCKKNPFPLFFPCHRITAKSGIGGYAFGERIKQELLSFEGYLASETASTSLLERSELTLASSFFS